MWVKAALSEDEEPSESVTKQTDVSGPGPPRILNATCEAPFTLAIYWHQPPLFNKTIDSYIIAYREENSFIFSNITVKPRPCNSTCYEDKVTICCIILIEVVFVCLNKIFIQTFFNAFIFIIPL